MILLNPPWLKVLTALASILICAIGLFFVFVLVFLVLTGRADQLPVIGWIMSIFWALVMLAIGVPAVVVLPRSLRDRVLMVDAERIALSGSRPWEVRWSDVQRLVLGRTRSWVCSFHIGPTQDSDRLILVPMTADFSDRHPELSRWRRKDASIHLPVIITNKAIARRVDALLSEYGGARYGGVVDGWQPYGRPDGGARRATGAGGTPE